MLILPNGCWCSTPAVSPKNWKSAKSSMKKQWVVRCRFYDPSVLDSETGLPAPHQMAVRGMNHLHEWQERVEFSKKLLSEMNHALKEEGYNPRTEKCTPPPPEIIYEIDRQMPVAKALQAAFDRLDPMPSLRNIKSTLKYVKRAIAALNYNELQICQVTKRHVRYILEQCGKTNPRWSSNRWNHYRTDLYTLFSVLDGVEAIDHNPVIKVQIKDVIQGIRDTLTPKEREKVAEELPKYPDFQRFLHIFFHSGARETELMRLQKKHVDLENQRFKVLVLKGGQSKEKWRTIETAALPWWREIMAWAPGRESYLFSSQFLPGPTPGDPVYISKFYRKNFKEKLGITADFYALKHLHATEVTDKVHARLKEAEEVAARKAGHVDTEMMKRVYDVRYQERLHDELKVNTLVFSPS